MKHKLLAGVCILVLCLIVSSVGVFAASTVSGYCGNYKCYGGISFGTNSASGYTSTAASSCASTVSITYRYKFGNTEYEVSGNGSDDSSYVSVTAHAKYVPCVNIRLKGYHRVIISGSSWYDYTNI
jgi:uncharacterized membrane protein